MFIQILVSVILPIFIIIGIGWVLDRAFRLDLPTLSKLNFYVFVPALMLMLLLRAQLSAALLLQVSLFTVVHMALLFLIAWAAFRHPRLRASRTVMTLGVLLNNCGNYGIPLVMLAFTADQGVAVAALAFIIMIQNFFTFTAGIWMMERQARSSGSLLVNMAKIPVIYVIILALVMRWQGWSLPQPIAVPMDHLANGLIAIALLTLGVQLSRARLSKALLPVTLVTGMRLLLAPLLAAALVPLFHFNGPVGAVMIVAAGFPVAVNLTILAAEYRQGEELTSQSIFFSTLLSGVTLTLILAWVR